MERKPLSRQFFQRSAFTLAAALGVPALGASSTVAEPSSAVAPTASAKPAKSAKSAKSATTAIQVAATVQSFYDQTKDVSARFRQTYVHKLYNRTERSKGQVTFKKPGKMRWDYDKPNGKVIVADGKRVLVYEPGQEGETAQVIEQQVEAAQLPQAMAFLMGTGRLETDFNFRLLDPEQKRFKTGHILELRPKRPTPHYTKILFYVASGEKVRGLVRGLVIIDSNGNRNRFDFSKLRFNGQVTDSTFGWQPPAGTRRVKM